MKTYKTKDGSQDGFIPGIGAIVNGQITTDQIIENPNLVEVAEQEPAPAPVAQVETPAPVPQILNKETN